VPLSWNEIKSRALAFSRKWDGETSERADPQVGRNPDAVSRREYADKRIPRYREGIV